MADYTLSARVTLDASQFSQGARNVQSQLNGITNTAGGMTKSIALGNVAANLFSKGMGMLSSSMGAAVKRLDTMKNFPILMESLGYNSQDAAASIKKISDNLDGLPTSTDAIVGMVQQLAPLTSSLDEATEISLAMNNALLAGGKATGVQEAAMSQYARMLSAGKVDMRGWRSLVNAMPGQLNQVTKAMLGNKATTNDLYEALKSGTVSFSDFNNEIVKLNKKGLPGMKSFEEQARAATGGIGTAVQNLRNRIAKGLADILEGIGRDRIAGFSNNLSGAIKTGLSGLSDYAGKAANVVFPMLEKLVANLPKIAAAIAAITGVKFVWGGIQTGIATLTTFGTRLTTTAARLSDFMANIALSGQSYGRFSGGLSDVAAKLSRMSPLAAGAAAAFAGIAAAISVKAISEVIKGFQNLSLSTDGLKAAALGATTELKNMDDALDVSTQIAGQHSKTLDELHENGAKLAKGMMERNAAIAESSNVLGVYMDAVKEFNGQTLDSEEDIATFKLAVDKLNESLGTEYTVEKGDDGRYRIMAGDAEVATAAIEKLIQMKQAEARVNVYQQNYEDALKQQQAAADTMADISAKIAKMESAWNAGDMKTFNDLGGQKGLDILYGQLEQATEEYNIAGEAAENAKGMMTNAATAAGNSASDYYRLIESNQAVSAIFTQNGQSISDFEAKLGEAGISQEQYAALSVDAQSRMAAAFDGSKESVDNAYKSVQNMNKAKDPNVNIKTNGKQAKGDIDGVSTAAKNVPASASVNVKADTQSAINKLNSLKTLITPIKLASNISVSARGNAAGGIVIPRHADGGIFAKPTLTGYGLVGEAGAEAIIPLSNKTYVRPFAQSVAAEMGGMSYGDVYVTLAYNADSNARQMANDLSREIKMRRALEVF